MDQRRLLRHLLNRNAQPTAIAGRLAPPAEPPAISSIAMAWRTAHTHQPSAAPRPHAHWFVRMCAVGCLVSGGGPGPTCRAAKPSVARSGSGAGWASGRRLGFGGGRGCGSAGPMGRRWGLRSGRTVVPRWAGGLGWRPDGAVGRSVRPLLWAPVGRLSSRWVWEPPAGSRRPWAWEPLGASGSWSAPQSRRASGSWSARGSRRGSGWRWSSRWGLGRDGLTVSGSGWQGSAALVWRLPGSGRLGRLRRRWCCCCCAPSPYRPPRLRRLPPSRGPPAGFG
ncbi:hypothetical protein FB475_3506 [Kribbella jejuensis]|uniref:Uncharacterized protein n=1 Tax=Kribbella jejuensis TaxID=236068 RepID=A0A542EVH4_9ACTN|nr:hypothetical protein FB475_3506 [Kribbella jejuensis]